MIISKYCAIVVKNSSAKGLILKTISRAKFSSSSLEGYRLCSSMNLFAKLMKYSCCCTWSSKVYFYCTCECIKVSSRSRTRVYFLADGGSGSCLDISFISLFETSFGVYTSNISPESSFESSSSGANLSCDVCNTLV